MSQADGCRRPATEGRQLSGHDQMPRVPVREIIVPNRNAVKSDIYNNAKVKIIQDGHEIPAGSAEIAGMILPAVAHKYMITAGAPL
ncbi:MAG: hypothetical protein PW843_08485 [Azospirillaceae bacterium]|nr:hypothetical protein [Azospirillaceae bacterium]